MINWYQLCVMCLLPSNCQGNRKQDATWFCFWSFHGYTRLSRLHVQDFIRFTQIHNIILYILDMWFSSCSLSLMIIYIYCTSCSIKVYVSYVCAHAESFFAPCASQKNVNGRSEIILQFSPVFALREHLQSEISLKQGAASALEAKVVTLEPTPQGCNTIRFTIQNVYTMSTNICKYRIAWDQKYLCCLGCAFRNPLSVLWWVHLLHVLN